MKNSSKLKLVNAYSGFSPLKTQLENHFNGFAACIYPLKPIEPVQPMENSPSRAREGVFPQAGCWWLWGCAMNRIGVDFGTSPHGLSADRTESLSNLAGRSGCAPSAKPVLGFGGAHLQQYGVSAQTFAASSGLSVVKVLSLCRSGRIIGARQHHLTKRWWIYPPAKLFLGRQS